VPSLAWAMPFLRAKQQKGSWGSSTAVRLQARAVPVSLVFGML